MDTKNIETAQVGKPAPAIFRTQNRVPEKIKAFQAAKARGLFTWQAGR